MALNATTYKVEPAISDMDRGYYATHALTLARHPSETDERMMVRVLAFALHAHEYLEFGQGMTNEDEADLWRKDLTGAIELWIDVGIPDEKWGERPLALVVPKPSTNLTEKDIAHHVRAYAVNVHFRRAHHEVCMHLAGVTAHLGKGFVP